MPGEGNVDIEEGKQCENGIGSEMYGTGRYENISTTYMGWGKEYRSMGKAASNGFGSAFR